MLHTRPSGFGHVRTVQLEANVSPEDVLSVLGANTTIRTGELVQMLVGRPVEETADSQTVQAAVMIEGKRVSLTLKVDGTLPWQNYAPSVLLSVEAASRKKLEGLIERFDPERDAVFILLAYNQRETVDPDRYVALSYMAIIDTPALTASGYDPALLAVTAIINRQFGFSLSTSS